MKLFCVTDEKGVDMYWLDYDTALQNFEATVKEIDYPAEDHVVTLARVEVKVNTQTLLKLLNGSSGYIVSEKVLKEWRGPAEV